MSNIVNLYENSVNSIFSQYEENKNILSFVDYLSLFSKDPVRHLRDGARYVLDAIDYYGSYEIKQPVKNKTRYRIFDQEFNNKNIALIGQEKAQGEIKSALESQVQDGKVSTLILLYGPNGSSKSTIIKNLFSGIENYSHTSEGALYRYQWIFPSKKSSQGTMGFGQKHAGKSKNTFAYLSENEINSTLECEVHDHPLLLIPEKERGEIIGKALKDAGMSEYRIPDYFKETTLCHRCKQLFDALFRSKNGNLGDTLAHIQVQRWFMSRRYRRGLVQVGPQMSVDAGQRQVTADRNLSSLPLEVQNMTMFENHGPLVNGAFGIVEFEDLLKRPLDAFKYLLNTIESGEVSLENSILKPNTVLMGTSNDVMIEAFKDHHDYPSFRDRLTLIKIPYITSLSTEQKIYELQILPGQKKHIAPHSIMLASRWAVLSRLEKPKSELYPNKIRKMISELTIDEKCDLYDTGDVPDKWSGDQAATLLSMVNDLQNEISDTWAYEGKNGASPRIVRQILLKAALSKKHNCLSPFAVIEEIINISAQKEYPFFNRESSSEGFGDFDKFTQLIKNKLSSKITDDVKVSSGLVDKQQHINLLGEYVNHVNHTIKGEKLLNKTSGNYLEPDEKLMKDVEKRLNIKISANDFRQSVISRIAAWHIENPKIDLKMEEVFPTYAKAIQDSYYKEHEKKVAKIVRLALKILSKENIPEKSDKKSGNLLLKNLINNFGYCENCAKDALAYMESEHK